MLTVYTVDSLEDNTIPDGKITLREAVYAANADLPVGDAPAGTGADTVQFAAELFLDPALLPRRLPLNGNQIVVSDDLTINGPGVGTLEIDAGSLSRHFEVNPGATLTMSDLTLINGNAGEGTSGGSIYTDGTLILTDLLFERNNAGESGGAIYATDSSPSVTIANSTITDCHAGVNGGGVNQGNGLLTITDTTIKLNTANVGSGNGGGVCTVGGAIIQGSTFELNNAWAGGGLWTKDYLTVDASFFRQNRAERDGGGVKLKLSAPASFTNVTFDENHAKRYGGAIEQLFNRPTVIHGGTFLNNRAEARGGAIHVWGGTLTTKDDTTFVGNVAGGYGGAIHAQGPLDLLDTTFTGNKAETYHGGAILAVRSMTVSRGAFTGNQAGYHGGAIYGSSYEKAAIGSSSFDSNIAGLDGGAVWLTADASILDSSFDLNSAGQNGGAIWAFDDRYATTISHSTVTNNSALHGGGILVGARHFEAVDVIVTGNTALYDGGGYYHSHGDIVLRDSLVADNQAGRNGGAVYEASYTTLETFNTTISGNRADNHGGGVFLLSSTTNARLVNTTVAGNRADFDDSGAGVGGGISTGIPVLTQNTIVQDNYQGTGATSNDVEGTLNPASEHTLIADTASAGGLLDRVNDNIVGHDPLLGPLQDNGGRSHTHALLPGSLAIDAGENAFARLPDGSLLIDDQRGPGFDRVVGLYVDIGAYEAQQSGGEIHGRKWLDLDQDGAADDAWGVSILANGSFEEGNYIGNSSGYDSLLPGEASIANWQILGSVDWVEGYWTTGEGRRAMDLSGSDAGAIAQTLITEPGRRYRVEFLLAGNCDGTQGLKTLRVSAAGEQADFTFDTTGHAVDDLGWQPEIWEFTAQNPVTTIVFESLTAGSQGPALDHIVVQPFGPEDVEIYLDLNQSETYDSGEPVTLLRDDDPNTPLIDETGTYQFIGLPPGEYEVREVIPDGWTQIEPEEPGTHHVTIVAEEVHEDLDFGNRFEGVIRGTKFVDLNANGIRDRNPFGADPPTVLMVIDVSASTWVSSGMDIGDVNGDGRNNWVIDAELYTMLQLQQELIALGWGSTAQVGIVVFAANGAQLDMDPATADVQLFTTPTADSDGDGTTDLEQILRSIIRSHAGTGESWSDFESGLTTALTTLNTAGVAPDETTLFFTSDGLANDLWSYDDEVEAIKALGVKTQAYGFGTLCDVGSLRRIDSFATKLENTLDVAKHINARSLFGDADISGDGRWLELGLSGVTIYLDANSNNLLDEGETFVVTRDDDSTTTDVDETGWYAFENLPIGQYRVREIVPTGYVQTAPLLPDYHQVDLRSGPIAEGRDFGNSSTPGGIEGFKGIDLDGSGVIEDDEPGQAGVTIYLDLNDNSQLDPLEPSYVTDSGMNVEFDAHWRFDEGSGTNVIDSSPAGRSNAGGLLYGPTWTDDGFDGALRFDGVDDAVWIYDSWDINFPTINKRTVSVWFMADNPTLNSRKQVLYEEGGTTNGMNIYIHDGTLYVCRWGGVEELTFAYTPLADTGQWRHVSLVLDADSTLQPDGLKLYLDGTLMATAAGATIPQHTANIGIGAVVGDSRFHDNLTASSGENFAGVIGDVRLHNRALSAGEVAALARVVDAPETGRFVFDNLPPGDYIVREVPLPGFEPIVGEHPIPVYPAQIVPGVVFVNRDVRGSVGGLKWVDSIPGNGERDPGEPGLAGVRIYLDNPNDPVGDNIGKWNLGEPYTWTLEDDAATAGVDELGTWAILDVVPGEYVVREEVPPGFDQSFPAGGGHPITVERLQVISDLNFGNVPRLPGVGGWKYHDRNENGQRDRNMLQGDLLVLTVDLSDSTRLSYVGEWVGDINGDGNDPDGDGSNNDILDLELAGLIALNQKLIDCGYGDTLNVAIVAFGDSGYQIDMDPTIGGELLATTPLTDADGDGMLDVEQALRALQRETYGLALRTDYAQALQTVAYTVDDLNADVSSMVFVSDGEPNNPDNYDAEVANLKAMGVTLSVFGAGRESTVYTLKKISDDAIRFESPQELVDAFTIVCASSVGGGSANPSLGSGDGRWVEPGVSGVVVYIDANNNGQLDSGERWTLSETDDPATEDLDETGRYHFDDLQPGTYVIREIVPDGWTQSPLTPYLTDASLATHFQFNGDMVDKISGVAASNHGATLDAGRLGLSQTGYFLDGAAWMSADLAALPLNDESRTLSVWVKSADGQVDDNADCIVNWGTAEILKAFGVMILGLAEWQGYVHGADVGSGIVADTEWRQLTFSYDGEITSLYVDGQLAGSAARALATDSGPLLIGIRPDLHMGMTFDGTVDGLRIYNRSLSDSEVADLFAWERSRQIADDAYVVRVDYGDLLTDMDFGNILNVAPVLDPIGAKSVEERTTLTFTATATDANVPDDTLTFRLDSGAPAGAAIDPATGVFTWTPDETQGPGDYVITVRVTDDGDPQWDDFETITVTVLGPPTVTGVYFRSSAWRTTFLDELDTQGHGNATVPHLGFGNPVGDGSQLDVMPWVNVDQVSVVFDQEMIVEAADLTVIGVTTSTYALDDAAFTYDPATYTATWSLVAPLPADKLLLLLDSDSTTGARSPSGVALDGEWANPTELTSITGDTFPSGDGTAGGDFAFRVDMHPGNVNGDTRVSFSDFFIIRARLGQRPGTPGYDVIHDLNGDARITFSDAFLSRARLGLRLPAGEPVAADPVAQAAAFDMALLSWVDLDSSDEDDSDILTQTLADDLALMLIE